MQGITKHFYDVRFWVYVFLYLLFSISIPHQVKAAFPNRKEEDKIVFGETYYLHGGEVITGDLIVFGGEVFLYPNSKVTQNVIIFGGNLNNEGIIEEDLITFGGNQTIVGKIGGDVLTFGGIGKINSTAEINGDLISFGGNIIQEDGSII